MGLLDHLWDDTVAGPRPESGLGKLRKYNSFSPSTAASAASLAVTRSITILRTSPPTGSAEASSAPASPASVPDSPLTPTTPKGEWRRLRRPPAAAEGLGTAEPRSPTGGDQCSG